MLKPETWFPRHHQPGVYQYLKLHLRQLLSQHQLRGCSGVASSSKIHNSSLTTMLVRAQHYEDDSSSDDDKPAHVRIPETVKQEVTRTRMVPIYSTVQCTCTKFDSAYTCGCKECNCPYCNANLDNIMSRHSCYVNVMYFLVVFLSVPALCLTIPFLL